MSERSLHPRATDHWLEPKSPNGSAAGNFWWAPSRAARRPVSLCSHEPLTAECGLHAGSRRRRRARPRGQNTLRGPSYQKVSAWAEITVSGRVCRHVSRNNVAMVDRTTRTTPLGPHVLASPPFRAITQTAGSGDPRESQGIPTHSGDGETDGIWHSLDHFGPPL